MFTIKHNQNIEYIEKKSKFISNIYKVKNEEEVKLILKNENLLHKNASHIVYAYIIGNDTFSKKAYSDDREPKGTAGKQIFNILENKQITDILVVTIRYFGGILLGIPGLIHAYSKGIKEVLKEDGVLEEKKDFLKISIQTPYTYFNKIKSILDSEDSIYIKEDFFEDIFLELEISNQEIIDKIKNISYSEIIIKKI